MTLDIKNSITPFEYFLASYLPQACKVTSDLDYKYPEIKIPVQQAKQVVIEVKQTLSENGFTEEMVELVAVNNYEICLIFDPSLFHKERTKECLSIISTILKASKQG